VHPHVQKLVSLVKMATVLEECSAEEQRSIVRFLWAKGFNSRNFSKEIFPVYREKCVSRKVVYNWVNKFCQGRSKVRKDARPYRPVEIATEAMWLRQLMLVYCGFLRTSEATGQEHGCRWGI
jgi:transposase